MSLSAHFYMSISALSQAGQKVSKKKKKCLEKGAALLWFFHSYWLYTKFFGHNFYQHVTVYLVHI